MTTLSWNIRGLGNPLSVHVLKDIVLEKKPDFVFLMETMVKRDRIEYVCKQIGFDNCFVVDSKGHGGGLAMLWKNKNSANLISYSNNHIDIRVCIEGMNSWRLTGFYGHPERGRRKDSWQLLRLLSTKSSLPWCCVGDFNDLLSSHEKQGLHVHPSSLIEGFRSAVEDSNLQDIGMIGYQFTWERRRGFSDWIVERLDRVLANSTWTDMFSFARVHNLAASMSDHNPILLYLNLNLHSYKIRIPPKFKFENAWLRDTDCKNVVEKSWKQMGCSDLTGRIKLCGEELMIWGSKIRQGFKQKIRDCKSELFRLRRKTDSSSLQRYDNAKNNYNKILQQQSDFWRQRAKKFWLCNGDHNTRYFHATASSRKRKNHILQLKDVNDNWLKWDSGLSDHITNYFTNLFTSNDTSRAPVIQLLSNQISDDQRNMLDADFLAEDVKAALFDMHPDKAPGPDGMNPAFFQNFWHIVGSDVSKACLHALRTGVLPQGANDTSIVLIPKKKIPEYVTDLRPISLCNVVYKIIAKMLANRLKKVLSSVISDAQSAFIPDRLITDNIMVAHEVIHFLKRKTQGKEGFVSLKIDMSKAFDRVEWSFVLEAMSKMGFSTKWINLINMCISSVRYSIVHGGHEYGPITPHRGLRQGCPLSPFLFLICAEGLSSLISSYARNGLIHGCKISRSAPPITHLFFADDSFLFFKANIQESDHIKKCLQLYELATGQQVNFSKSSISFSRNVSESLKQQLCDNMHATRLDDPGKYLGLPCLIGRSKNQIFSFIKDKLRARLHGWNRRFLSRAGKEILIKTVCQALPTFVMSVYLIPIGLCEELERMINSFWWGTKGRGRGGINWTRWDSLCTKKDEGGLGFRKLHEFNLSMLGKNSWRLLSRPNSLVAKIYKARYYPTSSLLAAQIGNNPSYIWRSLMASREIIRKGVRWKVGDGSLIQIGNDAWLPDGSDPYIQTVLSPDFQNKSVSCLMNDHRWDIDTISDVFNTRDKELILKIPLSSQSDEDLLMWSPERHGHYSVKSAYNLSVPSAAPLCRTSSLAIWKILWRINVPPKIKNMLWRACTNVLPTKDQLRKRRVEVDPMCPVCNLAVESTLHIFSHCSMATAVFHLSGLPLVGLSSACFASWLNDMMLNHNSNKREIICMVIWGLWYNRNGIVWNNKYMSPVNLFNMVSSFLFQWQESRKSNNNSVCFLNGDGDRHWTCPPLGSLKCNSDGAVFSDNNCLGFGWILRDSTGSMIAAKCGTLPGPPEAALAEILSLKEVLSWLKLRHLSNVIIELDALQVIEAMRENVDDRSYFGAAVKDCKLLFSSLSNCSLRFVYRSANCAAHSLARASLSMSGPMLWEIFPPTFLFPILSSDALF